MQQSLDGTPPNPYDDDSLKVTYPLKPCLQFLKEHHKQVAKLHHERYVQVKQLAQAIESYSSHLEPSFTKVQLPPTADNATCPPSFDLSHTYFAKLDDEFTRVYQEYERRIATVKSLCAEIINLWAELGTPQAQTDSNIITLSQEAPEQLGLQQDDLKRLYQKRDKLVEEKKGREKRLKDLRSQIDALWERLGVSEAEQKQFIAANRGCGMRIINEFEDELARLNELKRQNLGLFVEEARVRLQGLWDGLYFSEEEMLEFTPAFSGKSLINIIDSNKMLTFTLDVYSDALLAAHEAEIARLEALKHQRAPVLEKIDKHRSLVKDRDDLAASSQDASRLMAKKGERRDPTRLLREEKMRKRIAKDLPKIEVELQKILSQWENEYGRPFLVHGVRYIDELERASAKALPPRSKTPSIPTNPAPAHKKSQSVSITSKTGSIHGGLPPRSKTPSAMSSRTLPRSVAPPSVAHSTATTKSPSRIPARAPLSNLQYGNNSPPKSGLPGSANTVRQMAPPVRLPPPKMGDLLSKSTMTPRPNSAAENVFSSGIVRHVAPEDVYDDREDRTLTASSFHHAQHQNPQFSQSAYYPQHPLSGHPSLSAASSTGYPSRPPSSAAYAMAPPAAPYTRPSSTAPASSRNPSATSTASSSALSGSAATSGSENWETYSSASDAEGEWRGAAGGADDADDAAYYARLRAQAARPFAPPLQLPKRALAEPGWGSPRGAAPAGKKVRGLVAGGMVGREGSAVEGSEAGWTDEGEEGF